MVEDPQDAREALVRKLSKESVHELAAQPLQSIDREAHSVKREEIAVQREIAQEKSSTFVAQKTTQTSKKQPTMDRSVVALLHRLRSLHHTKSFRRLSQSMHKKWRRSHNRIRRFCQMISKGRTSKSTAVFYPFAGFDFMWAHACFPNAERYIMLGQMPALSLVKSKAKKFSGGEQIPTKITPNSALVPAILTALRGFLRNKYLGTVSQLKSAVTAARFFVTLLKILYGASIQAVQPCKKGSEQCVNIQFRMPGAKSSQQIRYWGGDVMKNAPWSFYGPFFQDMNNIKTPVATFSKAAEYNMFAPACAGNKASKGHLFQRVLSLIKRRSTVVISDDAGVPFHILQPRKWHRKLYGQYVGPGPVDYCKFYQPALARFYLEQKRKRKTRALPVKPFGYPGRFNCATRSGATFKPRMMTFHDVEAGRNQCMYNIGKCGGIRKCPTINPVCLSRSRRGGRHCKKLARRTYAAFIAMRKQPVDMRDV